MSERSLKDCKQPPERPAERELTDDEFWANPPSEPPPERTPQELLAELAELADELAGLDAARVGLALLDDQQGEP